MIKTESVVKRTYEEGPTKITITIQDDGVRAYTITRPNPRSFISMGCLYLGSDEELLALASFLRAVAQMERSL